MDKDNKQKNTNDNRGGDRRGGRRPASFDRPKPEFDQKIIDIRRVTRVVAGGRRFSFSVALVAGDKKGSVGLGLGKSGDTSLAITKALRNAKKNMIKLKLTKNNSIPHEVDAKFASSKVFISPNRGRGLVAGSALRDILVLAGVKDVTAKIHSGSKNKLNNAKATIEALSLVATKLSKVNLDIVAPVAPEIKD
jgi:small subunit ribosomal protein S5